MMTRLVFLRIDGPSDDSNRLDTSLFGIADISRVSDQTPALLNPHLLGLTVPMVGSMSDAWKDIRMSEGTYLARVKLPNGHLFTETISVPHGEDDLYIVLGESWDNSSSAIHERDEPRTIDPVDWEDTREVRNRQLSDGTNHFLPYETPTPNTWTPRIVETIVHPSRVRELLATSATHDGIWELLLAYLGNDGYIEQPVYWESSTEDSASFAWSINSKLRERTSNSPAGKNSEFLNRRYTVIFRGRITIVACLPHKWQTVKEVIGEYARFPTYARITATSQWPPSATRPISVSLTVSDPQIQSILGFLQEGDLSAARIIVDQCIDYLRDKFQNEYAAAAAGYILVMSPAGQQRSSPWEEWIGNLGHFFGNLPDGDILHATLLLQRGPELADSYRSHRYFPESIAERQQLAVELTLSSLGKGLPVYRQGLRLLASNLRILLDSDLMSDVKFALDRAYTFVTWLSMRVNPREAFTVVEIMNEE